MIQIDAASLTESYIVPEVYTHIIRAGRQASSIPPLGKSYSVLSTMLLALAPRVGL